MQAPIARAAAVPVNQARMSARHRGIGPEPAGGQPARAPRVW